MTGQSRTTQPRRRRPGGRLLATGALACAVLFSSAGCSEGGRDYAVPHDLCGVPMDQGLVSPFLPDGKKITQRFYDHGAESPRCRISVARWLVLYISSDVITADTDPLKVNHGLVRLGNPAPAAIGDAARVADRGAMAVADCTRGGARKRVVTLIDLALEHPEPEDTSRRRTALTQLLRAYFPKAMADLHCKKT
ncbi:hypothetical protein [Streptomyces sp. FBKL.4005]|uniref:hypothetical protein n=1 Tax=Streptomyces sp. FBKL.4005 TaxID=2015515 RepID=UPI001CB94D85|nr:hypothetical protein [Streptomyces sp. FBKL.4005]